MVRVAHKIIFRTKFTLNRSWNMKAGQEMRLVCLWKQSLGAKLRIRTIEFCLGKLNLIIIPSF